MGLQAKKVKKAPSSPELKGVRAETAKFIEEMKKAGMLGDIKKAIDFIPTGSWGVDLAIGDGTSSMKPGGIPRGYMTEVFGGESSGKTTLAIHACVEAQKQGGVVVYVDFEKSLRAQRNYIMNMGLDLDPSRFIHLEPDTYEEGAKAAFQATVRVKPSLVVVDSLAAAIPKKFISGDIEEAAQVGLHARQTTIFIGTMNKVLTKTNTALLIINQLRSRIKGQYDRGPDEETTGGRAQKYYMHLRLEMRGMQKEKVSMENAISGVKEDVMVNQQVKVTAIKNKMDVPFRSAMIYITFGRGIDNIRSLMALAEKRKVIIGKGAWYEYQSENDQSLNFRANGKNNLAEHLAANPDVVADMQPRLFPKVDAAEIQHAMESGEIDMEDMDEEMKALLAQMENGLENQTDSNADSEDDN